MSQGKLDKAYLAMFVCLDSSNNSKFSFLSTNQII